MKYSDYQVIVEKEYEKNRKNIFTCYFFILLSVIHSVRGVFLKHTGTSGCRRCVSSGFCLSLIHI